MNSTESTQPVSNIFKPTVAEDCTKIKTDKNSLDNKTQVKSSKVSTEKKAEIGSGMKMGKSPKGKRYGQPPTSKMVLKTIRILNMSKGAPVQAISEFVGEYYDLNAKSITPHIKRHLENGVKNGILEQVKEDANVERFKIKDSEKTPFQAEKTPFQAAKATGNSDLKKQDGNTEMKKKKPISSEMIVETIKSLKMRKGVLVDSIREHLEKNYDVNIKTLMPNVNKFLKNGVAKGILERVSGTGPEVRYKLKKLEGIAGQDKTKVIEKARKPDVKKDVKTYTISKKKSSTLTPAMVLETIRSLKMRKGAPIESIRKYIEKKYAVNLKTIMSNIRRYLRIGVQKGFLEQVDGTGAAERFKIKKIEINKMNKRMLKL